PQGPLAGQGGRARPRPVGLPAPCHRGVPARVRLLRQGARAPDAGKGMKAKVSVTLKRGILDPQGQAVQHALSSLGYPGVKDVRVGKLIELELATNDRAGAEAEVKAMCERLLANTIIEEYRIELVE